MFRRIRNIVELSKYRVEQKIERTANGVKVGDARLVNTARPKKKLAKIIEIKPPYQPLNEFEDADTNK